MEICDEIVFPGQAANQARPRPDRSQARDHHSQRCSRLRRALRSADCVGWLRLGLADAETVLFDRIRRIISEGRPVVWAFDQDAWAKELDYSQLPLELSRNIYESIRGAIIHYARLHYDQHGHLEFVHSETGVRTLKDEFDKVASHNQHHLDQISSALSVETGR